MISYHCDRCAGRINRALRITLTRDGDDRHFCGPNCLHIWMNSPGPVPTGDVTVTAKPQPKAPARTQDATEHTCEICGRTGSRRYMQTETGWRCAPSATKCSGNDAAVKASTASTETVRDAFRAIPATVPALVHPRPTVTVKTPPVATQAQKQAELATVAQAVEVNKITARCLDCTRTFTLTGRILEQAAEMHELKHSHIVAITEKEAAE